MYPNVHKCTPGVSKILLNSGRDSIDNIPSILPVISIFPMAGINGLDAMDQKAALFMCYASDVLQDYAFISIKCRANSEKN